jgi:hypothetical protein
MTNPSAMSTLAHRSAAATSFARLDNASSCSAPKRQHGHQAPSKAEDGPFLMFTTDNQLQFARQARLQVLLSKLEQEFEANAVELAGTDYLLLKARVRLLSDALLKLNHTYFSIGITADRSLYGRMHLAAGKGTLHLEILLGDDVEADEDTFVTLYRDSTQQWSLAGEFRPTLNALKKHLGLSQQA